VGNVPAAGAEEGFKLLDATVDVIELLRQIGPPGRSFVAGDTRRGVCGEGQEAPEPAGFAPGPQEFAERLELRPFRVLVGGGGPVGAVDSRDPGVELRNRQRLDLGDEIRQVEVLVRRAERRQNEHGRDPQRPGNVEELRYGEVVFPARLDVLEDRLGHRASRDRLREGPCAGEAASLSQRCDPGADCGRGFEICHNDRVFVTYKDMLRGARLASNTTGIRGRTVMTVIAPPTFAELTQHEIDAIRRDFPILSGEVNGRPLVYLDSGATSQKPRSVIDTERDYYEHENAAVHRGAHTLAALATERFEDARATVARFIGARENEIVWTSNATEALNLVAYAIGNATAGRGGDAAKRFRLSPGDELLVTEMEHHANLLPWQELAARTGAVLRYIPIADDGALRMEEAQQLVNSRTRVVAFTHVSNVLGIVNPVSELVALAHGVGALVVLDACQSAPHFALDVVGLDVDFAAFSGHKMLGPTGVGVLYGRAELLDALPPFLTGGSMITTVTMESAEYLPAPHRFEAGTQRVSQAIALGSAVDYLAGIGMSRIAQHESALGQLLVAGLEDIPGVTVLGPRAGEPRVGLASFDVRGVHSHDIGQFLDDRGIAVRVGHHCAQPLHRRLGVTSSTRASAYLYTTTDEVGEFLDAVRDATTFFGVTP